MRRPTPFGLLLALGVCCSAAAIVVQMFDGGGAKAAAPAPVRSAADGARDADSYVSPTTVTGSTPTQGVGAAAAEAPSAAAAASEPAPAVTPAPTEPPAPPTPPPTPTPAPPVAAGPGAEVARLQSAPVVPVPPPSNPAKAAQLLDLMNGARLDGGLLALERDAALDEVAEARARDLVANGYFDHYAPDGSSAFSELAVRGIRYRLAGENLARNNYAEGRTVAAAFAGLMGSEGHRANILEQRFASVGVAAVQSGRIWVYVTVFTN